MDRIRGHGKLMGEVLYKDESYALMGACFEVYKEMGPGYLELVYHECLEEEFRSRGVPFVHHPGLELHYKGRRLQSKYQADFVAYSRIVIEVKAVRSLENAHRAQLLNYLKATGFQLGLLVNFGKAGGLEWERLISSGEVTEEAKSPTLTE